MKILVVSSWCPFPPDNGSRLRACNLLRQLAARGHVLTLLTLSQPETDTEAAARELSALCAGGMEIFSGVTQFLPPQNSRGQKMKIPFQLLPQNWGMGGLLSPRPRSVVETWQPDMARAVRNAVQSQGYECVLFLEPGVASYAPVKPAVPCLLDCMEVTRFTRQADTLRVKLMRFKLRRYLQRLAPRFCAWTAVSEAERDAIGAFVGRTPPLFVLPNGVDVERNLFGPDDPADPERLVLNGAPDFAPNAEGAIWFAERVLPLVRKARPDAHLWVTGRADTLPSNHALRRASNVTLTGFLDDVRPAVQEAAVCVVPLFEGGGTRLKILEAMALGTPVVSTRLGAEGIAGRDGEHFLAADTPSGFAHAVLVLMNDNDVRQRLRVNARRLVENSYDWAVIGGQLDELLGTPCP